MVVPGNGAGRLVKMKKIFFAHYPTFIKKQGTIIGARPLCGWIRELKSNMRNTLLLIGLACLMSCGTSVKLTIPEVFKQQATMEHVKGARGNKMSFANFSTSRIRRGMHLRYPGWGGPAFIWENLLLNKVGIQKDESIVKEKAKFHYTLTDGKNQVEVFAHEKEVSKHLEYSLLNRSGFFSGYRQLQQYNYLFSAIISTGATQNSNNWVLQMTNIYDREEEGDINPFAHHKFGDDGLVTNGNDTIFIKPINTGKTVMSNGKEGQMPFNLKLLSGYELSTADGVIAIVDMIDRDIWFYNELDTTEKLHISAIATAIFARKVHDEKW